MLMVAGSVVSGHHIVDGVLIGPYTEEALMLMVAGSVVSGHYAADVLASGHHTADDSFQYDYIFLSHPSSHAYTNHTCSSDDLHPIPASGYADRNNVSGNIRAAHSKYSPAVLRQRIAEL